MRGLMLSLLIVWSSLVVAPASAAPSIACPPGQTTMLRGSGPARSGILLTWDQHVIGGGVVRADGTWHLPVQPAADAPSGDYAVAVTQRDSGQALGAWTCRVVNTTLPTPGQRLPDRATPLPTAHRTSTSTPTGTPPPTATAPAASTPVQPATATATPLPTVQTTVQPTADAAPPTTTVACALVCIVASDVTTDDAPGYLVIQNDGATATDLAGWTLRAGDATLPLTVTLAAGDVLLVYGTAGDDEPGMVYWPDAMLAAGDPITLTNAAGVIQQQWTLGTSAASTDANEVLP